MPISHRFLLNFILAGILPFTSCRQSTNTTFSETNSQPEAQAIGTSSTGMPPSDIVLNFRLEPVAENLVAPVGFTHAGDGSNRRFVLEQPGRIRIIKGSELAEQPFLDITSLVFPVGESYSERGLLGLAFHPDYGNNGRFFVYYSAQANKRGMDHKSVVAEYRVSQENPDRADMAERVVMEIDQPESNHNGGHLVFGPDGFLYIGLGDGGGAGDKHGQIGNGLDSTTVLGSILRIDVNQARPYSVPRDNPFVGREGADEIFAYGLRNPWRFSFDRETGQLYCGDVGQNKYEEVSIIEKGKNYGWRAREGFQVFDEELAQRGGGFAPPIIDYEHAIGNSITGGYVYRGRQYPALQGRYVFADWSGKVFYLHQNEAGEMERRDITFEGMDGTDIGMRVNSFGEDEKGEIYLCVQQEVGPRSPTGRIYRLALSNGQSQVTGSR
ncbi:PQQ-dependent sugar dehydrogenase [soil metagenome]